MDKREPYFFAGWAGVVAIITVIFANIFLFSSYNGDTVKTISPLIVVITIICAFSLMKYFNAKIFDAKYFIVSVLTCLSSTILSAFISLLILGDPENYFTLDFVQGLGLVCLIGFIFSIPATLLGWVIYAFLHWLLRSR